MIEILGDGVLRERTTGLSWKPPVPLEMRARGPAEAELVLDLADRTLTPELIGDLIDGYEFTQKAMGGIRIVFR